MAAREDNVDRFRGTLIDRQLLEKLRSVDIRDIVTLSLMDTLMDTATEEVSCVRSSCKIIFLDCSNYAATCTFKSKRESAAPCKKVQYSRTMPLFDPPELLTHHAIHVCQGLPCYA